MPTLDELLGIEPNDPLALRADALVHQDEALLDSLIRIRKDHFTQEDVAQKLGVKQSTIAAFERYGNDPKLSTVRRYAHAVGALIAHRVERDTGQLLDDRKDEWVAVASADVHIGTNSGHLMAAPTFIVRTSGLTAEYRKSDFAAAA
jgi:DNA-binding XRE family transcriptional regulator